MTGEPAHGGAQLPWHQAAALLLETVPGVVSAAVEGSQHSVSEVRVWYEPTWPVGQVMDAVHTCLTTKAGARITGTRFRAVVAEPDRRAARRARPVAAPAGPVERTSPPVALRLIGHEIQKVQPGVVGVQVWIEWSGRTFSGAAVGPDIPPGSLRTPALATLRALLSCLQAVYDGPMQPGLVLESVVQVAIGSSPVVVVALTAAENARPRALSSACAEEGALPVIKATLTAAARTVTRWLKENPNDGAQRLTLIDFNVGHSPSGELDVGVRLSGSVGAVDRRRNGRSDKAAQMGLAASATLDAVHELLRLGLWKDQDGDLRHMGSALLRTGEHDIVVVLAEVLVDGRWIPLAGASSADGGMERAAITAMLQATNPLVAGPAAFLLPSANTDPPARPAETPHRTGSPAGALPR